MRYVHFIILLILLTLLGATASGFADAQSVSAQMAVHTFVVTCAVLIVLIIFWVIVRRVIWPRLPAGPVQEFGWVIDLIFGLAMIAIILYGVMGFL